MVEVLQKSQIITEFVPLLKILVDDDQVKISQLIARIQLGF